MNRSCLLVLQTVFFDGGTHWGDFLLNLSLGFTGVWLPVTLTSLFRALNLRYRFTDRRFTIMSSLDAADRRDYPYSVRSALPLFFYYRRLFFKHCQGLLQGKAVLSWDVSSSFMGYHVVCEQHNLLY